jgi:hypothetical protein
VAHTKSHQLEAAGDVLDKAVLAKLRDMHNEVQDAWAADSDSFDRWMDGGENGAPPAPVKRRTTDLEYAVMCYLHPQECHYVFAEHRGTSASRAFVIASDAGKTFGEAMQAESDEIDRHFWD